MPILTGSSAQTAVAATAVSAIAAIKDCICISLHLRVSRQPDTSDCFLQVLRPRRKRPEHVAVVEPLDPAEDRWWEMICRHQRARVRASLQQSPAGRAGQFGSDAEVRRQIRQLQLDRTM